MLKGLEWSRIKQSERENYEREREREEVDRDTQGAREGKRVNISGEFVEQTSKPIVIILS